jgi:hypothetical protein
MGSTAESLNVARKPRFPISLPPWHEKRLIWWAYLKGTSKTSLAQNTLQARIEANDSMIQAGLLELAEDQGISVDDLKRQILEDTNLNPDD